MMVQPWTLAGRGTMRSESMRSGGRKQAILAILALGLAAIGGCAPDEPVVSTPAAAETPAAAPTGQASAAQPFVLVAYWSQTGMTKRLAEAVAEGARSAGAVVRVLAVDSVGGAVLDSADAVLLGSPTHWANMAAPMKAFIDSWPVLGFAPRDRIGGAFATGATGGGGMEMVVTSLLLAMLNDGMIVVGPVFREGDIEFGNFGVAAATGSAASPSIAAPSLDAARALGRRAAEVAAQRPRGR